MTRIHPMTCERFYEISRKNAQVRIVVGLHSNEVEYLRSNVDDIGERTAVGIALPGVVFEEWRQRVQASGQHARQITDRVQNLAKSVSAELSQKLAASAHQGIVDIHSNGNVSLSPNLVLQAVWSIYEPQSVGIVDYHGPQRHFSRENLGGVHLSLRTQEEGQRQSVLYNYAAKYANLKTTRWPRSMSFMPCVSREVIFSEDGNYYPIRYRNSSKGFFQEKNSGA